MKKEQIETAIWTWRQRLNLTHWKIRITGKEPEDKDAVMSIIPIEGRYVADLYISDSFYDQTPREMSNTIAHELIHMPGNRVRDLIRYITKNMSQDMKEAAYDLVTMEVEFLTDWMATVLADQLPIPDSLLESSKEMPD